MAVAILYVKDTNTIHDVCDNVISLWENKLVIDGGMISGWDQNVIGVIISNNIEMIEEFVENNVGTEEDPIILDYKVRKVKHGNDILGFGDTVPDITDITDEFVISNGTDNRIADLELMLAEILLGGM